MSSHETRAKDLGRRVGGVLAGREFERTGARRALRNRLKVRNVTGLARYLMLIARYPPLRRAGLFYVARGAEFVVRPGAEVSFGRGVSFMRDLTCWYDGVVTIGDDVFFNRGCHLIVHESVTIGDGCLFGEMVTIHDDDHAITERERPLSERGLTTAPVVIEDSVWVGAKATITKGVRIGRNSVIGANAVVTRDIPPDCVAAGVPARVIRHLASS